MAHSNWTLAAVFIPPLLVYLLLAGYYTFLRGVETKTERRQLKDYSAAEIAYAVFAALVVISGFVGGLSLLDRFEPVGRTACTVFSFSISLPFCGAVVAEFLENVYKKGPLFKTVLFSAAIFPALLSFTALAYNGLADATESKRTTATVVDKRMKSSRGGGVPLVVFRATSEKPGDYSGIREKKVDEELYEKTKPGVEMALYIRQGALGIPWIEKLAEN